MSAQPVYGEEHLFLQTNGVVYTVFMEIVGRECFIIE